MTIFLKQDVFTFKLQHGLKWIVTKKQRYNNNNNIIQIGLISPTSFIPVTVFHIFAWYQPWNKLIHSVCKNKLKCVNLWLALLSLDGPQSCACIDVVQDCGKIPK